MAPSLVGADIDFFDRQGSLEGAQPWASWYLGIKMVVTKGSGSYLENI
jgi:hypothetical protein